MQQVKTHIPFDTAMQFITNAAMNNLEDVEKSKDERDFVTDIGMELQTTMKFWETYLLHMKHTRAEITIPLIEWRSLLGRTSHVELLEQLPRYKALYGSINRAYILVAYGRVYRLVEGARALMDRTKWYPF